ncbi:hypothetical protein KJ557_02975 [Patescibacteria group bacterium]|nr:hypothetical protein [Patescibacteria group bacterium]
MPPKKNLKSSPRLARQKLPKNLAEKFSAKCLTGFAPVKPAEFWLGIRIDWLEIQLTAAKSFICWTQEKSKI